MAVLLVDKIDPLRQAFRYVKQRHPFHINANPVKHGKAKQAADWSYSSFHHYVRLGVYPSTWNYAGTFDFDAGEQNYP